MRDADFDFSQTFDAIIIGTGMGGATVGHALARQGLSVLFLEKGGAIAAGGGSDDGVTPDERLSQGWWPHSVSQRRATGGYDRFFAPIGCAWGGSSIRYAAALERMAPSDFEALQTRQQLVPPWPVSYEEFLPFYEAAESLYGIEFAANSAGEERISEWDRALMAAMRRNGLKPEMLHVAMRYDNDCQECIGRVCHRNCKSDSRSVCLDDALRHPRCKILDNCDVQMLDADGSRIKTIRDRKSVV